MKLNSKIYVERSWVSRTFYSYLFFVMSLGSMGVLHFKAILLIVVLLSSPIMFSPSFAEEDVAIDQNDNVGTQQQPSDPMPTPPHPPHPDIHNDTDDESIKDPGPGTQPEYPPTDANTEHHPTDTTTTSKSTIDIHGKGKKMPGSTGTIEVYSLGDSEENETRQLVTGTVIISGNSNEQQEFECIITYLVTTSNGPALMQFLFLVKISPGTYDDIKKICYGKAVANNATVEIKILTDNTMQMEILNADMEGVPEDAWPPHTKQHPDEKNPKEQQEEEGPQRYDAPVYNLGPEFWIEK